MQIILSACSQSTNTSPASPTGMTQAVGPGVPVVPHFLLIDDSGHYLLIDDAGHKLRIQ